MTTRPRRASPPEEVKPKPKPRRKPPMTATVGRGHSGYNDANGRRRVAVELQGKMALLYAGELSVADMDDDELARMQFKDKNGNFTGRPPSVLPSQLVNMIRRELLERLAEKRRVVMVEMQDVLISVAKFGEKDSDRIKAAMAIIDRELGKTPETIKMETTEKGFNVTLGRAVKVRRASGTEDE